METVRPRKPEREVILVTGQTGSGKTAWTRSYLARRKRNIILDPIGEYPGQYFEHMDELIEHVKTHKLFSVKSLHRDDLPMLCAVANGAGDCTLVIEEAQAMAPQSSENLPEALEDVIYRGRHYNTTLVMVAQRASTIHIAARSQWRRLLVFGQSEDRDLSWLAGQTRLDEEEIYLLPPLYGYDCRRWTRNVLFSLTFHGERVMMTPVSSRAVPSTPEGI